MTTAPAGKQRLTLHVGLPKSGTTYLQGLLASHRDALRGVGAIYPFVRPEAMFRAAVEVRHQHEQWGLPADGPDGVDGTWQALLDRVREVGLPGIISHEIFAGCSPEDAARVGRDLRDFDVHLVATCRDPLRQAMAHWQEEVKNGRPWTYADFVAALPTPEESADAELGYWRSQDLVGVLDRWSAAMPDATVHVVTAPPPGSPPEVLWERFAEAVALPADVLDPRETDPASGPNRSLGAAQVRLLREVLVVLDGRIRQPEHAQVVKRWFAQQVLAGRAGEPAAPTPELAAHLAERSSGWADAVRERGWAVHGELGDLEVPAPGPAPHPDDVPRDDLGSPEDLAALLLAEVEVRREARDDGARDDGGPGGLLGRLSRRARRARRQPRTPRRSRRG